MIIATPRKLVRNHGRKPVHRFAQTPSKPSAFANFARSIVKDVPGARRAERDAFTLGVIEIRPVAESISKYASRLCASHGLRDL